MRQSTLGTCIRTLRIQNNMTQTQLAERLNVTDKAVSKWERDLSYPDMALFPKLADILGATVNDLLGECGEECHPSRLLQAFEISRDIRTPLHIILGYVEIAKKNHDDPEMLLKYLEGIRVSGEYLMTLFDRVTRATCCCSEDECSCDDFPISQADLEKYLREKLEEDADPVKPADFSGKRILIAEDMAINREIAAEVLRQTGAETVFAEDGKACLERVKHMPAGYYDLILMDIMMPEMDGLEATRQIRSLPDHEKASIPIIAMTTNVSEKDREAAFEAGMDAFSEKPIFVEKLFETVKQYLER